MLSPGEEVFGGAWWDANYCKAHDNAVPRRWVGCCPLLLLLLLLLLPGGVISMCCDALRLPSLPTGMVPADLVTDTRHHCAVVCILILRQDGMRSAVSDHPPLVSSMRTPVQK